MQTRLLTFFRTSRFKAPYNLKMFLYKHLDWNILRWFFVGCLTVSIDWFIFKSLYAHIGSVILTNLVSWPCSTLFNYTAHRLWTFKSDQGYLKSGVRYGATLCGGYLLNTVLIKISIILGNTPELSKVLAAAIQAPMSFLVLKIFVFNRRSLTDDVE